MNIEILKLKEELNRLLTELPISSPEILNLSRKIDVLIAEFQKDV